MATKTDEIWVQEGEVKRKLEGEELAAFLAHRAEVAAKQEAEKLALEQAAADKAALLARLGITQDEAKLLLS